MKLRNFIAILLAAFLPFSLSAKKKSNKDDQPKSVYLFGFASNFDSNVIYLTDIQKIDSAFIMKSGFLYSRDSYSYQLTEHMKKIGQEHAYNAIFFSNNRDKIEKRYVKLKNKYLKPKKKKKAQVTIYSVQYITSPDFQFVGIPADDDLLKKDAVWKAEQKAAKKKAKAEAKENKRKVKEAKQERKAANKATIQAQKEKRKQEAK